MTMMPSQKLGRGQADDGNRAPQEVGGGILANRRVDAYRQGYHEPYYDCHQTELDGYRQSIYDLLLHRHAAHQ